MAAFGTLLGVDLHQKLQGQPSSSADSQQTYDSPHADVTGSAAARRTPDVLCTEFGIGQLDGHSTWEHPGHVALQMLHRQVDSASAMQYSASPAVAAVAAALTDVPDDPAAAKATFKQLTSHMTPAELTELQHIIREQRLQRQQQDMLAVLSASTPAGPALGLPAGPLAPGLPAVPSLDPSFFAGHFQQGLIPADAMRLIGEAAVALNTAMAQPNSTCKPAHFTNYLAEMASQLAMIPSASAPMQQDLQQPQQQQQCGTSPAAGAAAASAGQTTAAAPMLHPGMAPHRAPRSSRIARRSYHTASYPWMDSSTQQQAVALSNSPQAEQTTEPAQPAAAAAAAAGPSADQEPSASGLKARFARLSAEAQASILAQLQELEAAEEERRAVKEARRAAREAAAANAQRRSNRSRKPKTVEDADSYMLANNSNRSASPDTAAAAATPERAGSADANNSGADHASTPTGQQQPPKKRVRFAFADSDDQSSDGDDHDAAATAVGSKPRSSSTSASPQIQGLECTEVLDGLTVFHLEEYEEAPVKPRVVRRVGPRAQARKRMHKKTIRRRRPQRAPLS